MTTALQPSAGRLSGEARARIEAAEGGPFLLNDWTDAVFIHLEADAAALQRQVPFELDLHEGRAYVSLVAFTLRRLRPCLGGRVAEWAGWPLSGHGFLNLRTYVRHDGEAGIYFLAEWLPNPLSVAIGPRAYGLPYRRGRLEYRHDADAGRFTGRVRDAASGAELVYAATGEAAHSGHHGRPNADGPPGDAGAPAEPGSLEEFLLERYTAFTWRRSIRRRFRVWHEPWALTPIEATIEEAGLLAASGPWHAGSRIVAAHASPGVKDVWIGRPCCIQGPGCERTWNDEGPRRPEA